MASAALHYVKSQDEPGHEFVMLQCPAGGEQQPEYPSAISHRKADSADTSDSSEYINIDVC